MKKVKSIISKAKCKLGYHTFEQNNGGIEDFIMYDFFRCKHCDRYTIVCHGNIRWNRQSGQSITPESILRAKERYDKVQLRKVLIEKYHDIYNPVTGKINERKVDELMFLPKWKEILTADRKKVKFEL